MKVERSREKERAVLAAMCVGAAQAAVDDAVKYTLELLGLPAGLTRKPMLPLLPD